MEEPSVLDYIKSKLFPWKYPAISFPPAQEVLELETAGDTSQAPSSMLPEAKIEPDQLVPSALPPAQQKERTSIKVKAPWFSLAAVALAILAQASLAPAPVHSWIAGIVLFAAALACLVVAVRQGEWEIADPKPECSDTDPPKIQPQYLIIGSLLAIAAFFSYNNLLFTPLNLLLNLAAFYFIVRAFWLPANPPRDIWTSFRQLFAAREIRLEPRAILEKALLILAVLLVIFFRFHRLEQTPAEMNSDHAEKILDISRVLAGQTSIFFPNNGGREALQMYLVAALHRVLDIPLGFTILKLSTALIGILALPFIFLLGKEIGNRRIAWLALIFAGVAYWPNVISRLGLRLPFYVLFSAATMYFLLRGFRSGRRNDFILSGICLGLSFYGYSADRLLPLLVVLAFGLYLLHPHVREKRTHLAISFLALVLVSFVVFIPLLRYIIAQPELFLFRTLTRVGSLEQPLPTNPILIFFTNFANALGMFSWSAGVIWPASIPNVPALGVVSGALFYLGAGLVTIRYIRHRHWQDLFLLLSIPVFFLPSVLALAFPGENPNLYRTGGALVTVFLLVAIALDSFLTSLSKVLPSAAGKRLAYGLAALLFALSAVQEYNLVFNDYHKQYSVSAWNSSEMGEIASDFIQLYGQSETVYVVGKAHWVDTRLVAIQAGVPYRDFAIFVEQIPQIQADPRAKLFILHASDAEAIAALPATFPMGWFQFIKSNTEGKDFLVFIVPPQVTPQ